MMKLIVGWLFTASAFSLVSSNIKFAKPFDVLIFLTGVLIILQKPAWAALSKIWPHLRPYFFYLLAILVFVVAGQITSYYSYGIPIDEYPFLHYARVIFNGGVLLFSAFLVYFLGGEKILRRISWAIFLSPVVVAPVFLYEKLFAYYLDGGRLKGLLITAVIYGIWTMVSFLLGIGIFVSTRKLWKKTLIFLWLGTVAAMMLWSGSRAAWLGTLLGIAIWITIYAIKKKDLKNAMAITAAAIAAFILGYSILPAAAPETQNFIGTRIMTLAKDPFAAQDHTAFWKITSEFALKHPGGLGFGRFKVSRDPSVDVNASEGLLVPRSTNTLLEIWIAGGVFATIAALLIAINLLVGAYGAIRNRDPDIFSLAWLIILPAFLLDIFFTDGFFHRHVWFILGIALGAIIIQKTSATADQNET